MRRRESDGQHPARRFAKQVDVLERKRIAEAAKIPDERIERPRIAGPRIARAAVTAQIAADHAIVTRQYGHPVPPELRVAPEPVLDDDRLPRPPRIGEIVVFVVSDVPVDPNFSHRVRFRTYAAFW